MQLSDSVSKKILEKVQFIYVTQDIFCKIHKHKDIFSIKSNHISLYGGKLICK